MTFDDERNLNLKLRTLKMIFKPSMQYLKKDSRFMTFKDDVPGWSDGFIADLTGIHTEAMRALAIVKGAEVLDTQPDIKKVIPTGNYELVVDVEFNLTDNCLILIGEKQQVRVNPKMLTYFWKAYERFVIDLQISVDNTSNPIKVMNGNDLLGLIMPIRQNR